MPTPASMWIMPLKGVRLLYMHETDAAILIGLEAESKSVVCSSCGSVSVVGYGKMTWRIRDLPIKKKAVFLEIKRRRLRCRDCLVTFNEPVLHISANHRATARLVQSVWKMALHHPFATLAKTFGMDEKTIRNIFKDTFDSAENQFKIQSYPPAPSALAIRLPIILRRQRVMWINLDQCILVDMNEKATPEFMCETLRRVARDGAANIYVPPDASFIRALQASTQSQLLLDPSSMRAACKELIVLGRAINGALSYVDILSQFLAAKNESVASQLWQNLISPPPGLRTKMRPLIAAIELLPLGRFAAFGQLDHACDGLIEQLGKILSTGFSRRSYDVICAIALFDKTLQKTVRAGVAKNGAHLAYQKINYGTSIPKLVTRLEKLTCGNEVNKIAA